MKQIKIPVNHNENFTPSSLMHRYAKQNPGVTYSNSLWGNARLTIEGNTFEYHHWGITAQNGIEIVTLFLEPVNLLTSDV